MSYFSRLSTNSTWHHFRLFPPADDPHPQPAENVTFCTTFWPTSTLFHTSPLLRYGEPGGAGPSGARVQDALSRRVPGLPARAHADLLAQGARRAADLRVPPELPGRLLHLHWTTVPAGREPLEILIQPSMQAMKAISFPRPGNEYGLCLGNFAA